MNTELIEQIKNNLSKKTTEELLSIWVENDRAAWSEEAFEAIRILLTDRGASIPEQKNLDSNADDGTATKKRSLFSTIPYFICVVFLLVILIFHWNELGHEILALKSLPKVPLFSTRVFVLLLIVFFVYRGMSALNK